MAENPSDYEVDPQTDAQGVHFLDLVPVLLRRKWLILGLPILVTLLAAGYALRLPNIYTATVKVLPPQQQSSVNAKLSQQFGNLAGMAAGMAGIKNPNDVYIGILKSRTVADRLIERFKLKALYDTPTMDGARIDLAGSSLINAGKDSIINVQFSDTDPKRAAAIANGYVEELIRLTDRLAVTDTSQRRLFYERLLASTRDNLVKAESALQQMQERTGLIEPQSQTTGAIQEVAQLKMQIASRQVQLDTMKSFATEQNPDVVMLKNEIASLRGQLGRLESQTGVGSVSTARIPEIGLRYVRLLREVKLQETLFEMMAKQLELAKMEEAKDPGVIQILDSAVPPELKTSPVRSRIVLVAALISSLLALPLAFLVDFASRQLTSPETRARWQAMRASGALAGRRST